MKVKVSVGASTVAGYSVSVAAVVAAVLAYVHGDRSEQTLGVITAGVVAVVSFAITQVGRYAQARALIREGHVSYPAPDEPAVIPFAPPEPGDVVSALPDVKVTAPHLAAVDEGDGGPEVIGPFTSALRVSGAFVTDGMTTTGVGV